MARRLISNYGDTSSVSVISSSGCPGNRVLMTSRMVRGNGT
jgi:hypothetical protein